MKWRLQGLDLYTIRDRDKSRVVQWVAATDPAGVTYWDLAGVGGAVTGCFEWSEGRVPTAEEAKRMRDADDANS